MRALSRVNHSCRIAVPRLLKEFPPHCDKRQLEALNYLVWAAIRHMDRVDWETLMAVKLSHGDIDTIQRIHWVTAGVIVVPENYLQLLESLVGGDDRRIHTANAS